MTAILVPYGRLAHLRSTFLKLGARRYLRISTPWWRQSDDGHGGEITQARVAVGACSAVARRLPALEARLIGRKAAAGRWRRRRCASGTADADRRSRASASYRPDAALTLLRRGLEKCAAGDRRRHAMTCAGGAG